MDAELALRTYYGVSEVKAWTGTGQATAGEVYAQVAGSGTGKSYYLLKTATQTPPPADRSSSAQWLYLGDADTLQKMLVSSNDQAAFEAAMIDWYQTDRIHRRGENRNRGNVGDLYAHDVPGTGVRHYYRLKLQAYGPFPAPSYANRSWDYLGHF